MAIIKWEPFDELDRFFDGFPSMNTGRVGFDMAVDLYEESNNVIAEMNVPGIDPEKVDVTVEGDFLRIAGRREEEQERKGKQFYAKEIRRGSFERTIRLPERVDDEHVTAEYKEGVLRVVMPKRTSSEKGKVKVEVKK